MVAYADTAGCLRATILRYFGDPAACEPCGACGNCDRQAPLDEAAREFVRKILSGIVRAGERFGRRKVAAMLAGDVDELPESLKSLSTTGLLQHAGARSIEQWIDAAGGAGLIRASDDQYRTLSLTPLGREVMAGRVDEVRMAAPAERPAKAARKKLSAVAKRGRTYFPESPQDAWSVPISLGEAQPTVANRARRTRHPATFAMDHPHPDQGGAEPVAAVVDALRAWRLDVARQRAVAPFVIMHDRTLVAIATSLPRSMGQLGDVPGIGPAKLASYGNALLALVAAARG